LLISDIVAYLSNFTGVITTTNTLWPHRLNDFVTILSRLTKIVHEPYFELNFLKYIYVNLGSLCAKNKVKCSEKVLV
jgi:uncharacterized membrane protein YwaF